MATSAELWQVWHRPKGTQRGWEKVPGLEPMRHADAFNAMVAQEWIASDVDYELALIQEGQVPSVRQYQQHGNFYEGYKTKVMKPR